MDNERAIDQFIRQTLSKHQNIGFVKRILHPEDYPVLDLGDGMVASHMMATAEIDGPTGRQFIAYPTILYDGRQLKEFGPDEALETVMKSGNFIPFESEMDADLFARQYKRVWDVQPGPGGRPRFKPSP